ncbi:MAG TPA: redox-regulated ATPase YchF [Egibacteraceae bacterium]|nr:redox-regulated ATPase YchF [Egibacteraceae bacterium]
MALQVGIVGLPNVGKSTLFNAVSAAGAEAANYPFATIEPNVGVVALRDERLDTLARLNRSAKVVPTSVEFLDIAGLVKGASQGEGLGNQFLSHIREVDAIVHVVRCFDDPDIVHVDGSVDPVRDIEVIDTELILKDLETVEKRAQRSGKAARVGDKDGMREAEVVAALSAHLEGGSPARTFAFTEDDRVLRRELALLTDKPVLYAANVAESDLPDGNAYVDQVRAVAEKEGATSTTGMSPGVIVVCAEAEAQISELPEDERAEFLSDLGLERSGLDQLVHAAYRLLGLITFFTSGPQETRAWTVRQGTKAPQAAGKIHGDIERGFIRAETISYGVYAELGGEQAVKDAGKLRVEGKDYIVQDGDVMHFRFNV